MTRFLEILGARPMEGDQYKLKVLGPESLDSLYGFSGPL